MGDFKRNNELADIAAAREARANTNTSVSVVKNMIGTKPLKNKVVTSKVYPETWAKFTAINKARGMSNNSVINMLISDYVNSKEELLK